jgi:hypothetical protein
MEEFQSTGDGTEAYAPVFAVRCSEKYLFFHNQVLVNHSDIQDIFVTILFSAMKIETVVKPIIECMD